jgi:hypothetical protein
MGHKKHPAQHKQSLSNPEVASPESAAIADEGDAWQQSTQQ